MSSTAEPVAAVQRDRMRTMVVRGIQVRVSVRPGRGVFTDQPPLLLCNGIGASLEALQPLVDGRMWLLALIAVANVALGVVYYLRWAALAVIAAPVGDRPVTWNVLPAEGIVLGGAFALVVVLSLAPGPIAAVLPGVLH